MNQLQKYDAARYALSVAVEVDEVKDIRDKAEAMAAYARQAKDTELVQWATEIKVRAERRAGQMLAEMPKATGKSGQFTGGHTMLPPVKEEKTLADIGVTKNESSRWQKLAAVPESQFEQAVTAAKEVAGEVTTAAMLRATRASEPEKAKPAPKDYPVNPATPEAPAAGPAPEQIDQDREVIAALSEENDRLNDRLAVAAMDATDEERAAALTTIAELRAENKTLRATNKQLTNSRNWFQNQVAELQKQINRQRREIDKALGTRSA